MKLLLKRKEFFPNATRGELWLNREYVCFTLEDKDRGLSKDMALHVIESIKVKDETCIPYGLYSVTVNGSLRFHRPLPLLIGVPGFTGIRIHPGNTAKDTSGCILVGRYKGADEKIVDSRSVFDDLFSVIAATVGQEPVTIEIVKELP